MGINWQEELRKNSIREIAMISLAQQGALTAGNVLTTLAINSGKLAYQGLNVRGGKANSPVINSLRIADRPPMPACAVAFPTEMIVFDETLYASLETEPKALRAARALSAGGGTGIKGILEAVREDPNIDAMVVHFNFSTYMAQMIPEQASLIARNTIDSVIKAAKPSVPTILVVRGCGELEIEALKAEAQASCREHRIPVLGSLESALRAMAVLVRRQENLRNN